MNPRRFLVAVLLALFVGGGSAPAGELPDDLVKLLPESHHMLLVMSSLSEAQREWADVLEAIGEDTDDQEALVDLLADGLPGFAGVVDDDRPLALSLDFTGLMNGATEPDMVFVFPVDGELSSLQFDTDQSPFVTLRQEGRYAALLSREDMVTGTWEGSREPLPGVLSMNLKARETMALARPVVEMGLAGMLAAASDSTGSEMTPQQAELLAESIREIIDALNEVDIAFQRKGDDYVVRKHVELVRGSRLGAGKQPDIDDAVELTRLLPAGSDLVSALALDIRRPFTVFEPLYRMNLGTTANLMEPADAAEFLAWYEESMRMMDWSHVPSAFAVSFVEDQIVFEGVYATDRAPELFGAITGLYDRMAKLPLPFILKPLPDHEIDGVTVHTYSIVVDAGNLDPTSRQTLSTTSTMQLAEMNALMRRFLPELHVARVGDHVVVSSSSDRERLAKLLAACARPRGKPDRRVVEAVKLAGPETQEVIVGDLGSFLRWTLTLLAEIEPDDVEFDPTDFGSLPCAMSVNVGLDSYGGTLAVGRDEILDYLRSISELED